MLAQSACGSDEVLYAECRLLFSAGVLLPVPVGLLTLPTRKSAPVRHRWPDEWKCSFLHLFFKELPNDRDIPRCHPRNPRQQYALLTSLSNKKNCLYRMEQFEGQTARKSGWAKWDSY